MPFLNGVASPLFLIASVLGCQLDCNLDTGLSRYTGGAATDDTAIINQQIALAAAANPARAIVWVQDGASLISGLVVPNGIDFVFQGFGYGTGYFLASGSNSDMLRNIPNRLTPMDSNAVVTFAIAGGRAVIENLRWNGNGGSGYAQYTTSPGSVAGGTGNGNSSSKNRMGPADANGNLNADQVFCMFRLQGLASVRVRNVWLENSASFNIYCTQCEDIVVESSSILAFKDGDTVTETSTDGIHVSGNCRFLRVSNTRFRIGDDAIALNAPEGQAGMISRVIIEGCVFDDCLAILRTYATGPAVASYLDSVIFANCIGNAQVVAFISGTSGGTTSNRAAENHLKIIDSIITAPIVTAWAENMGVVEFNGVTWRQCPATSLPVTDVTAGWINFNSNPVTVEALTLSNCKIVRSSGGNSVQVLVNGSTSAGFGSTGGNATLIRRLTVRGLEVVDIDGTYPAIPDLVRLSSNSNIGTLIFDGVESSSFSAIIAPANAAQIATTKGTLL